MVESYHPLPPYFTGIYPTVISATSNPFRGCFELGRPGNKQRYNRTSNGITEARPIITPITVTRPYPFGTFVTSTYDATLLTNKLLILQKHKKIKKIKKTWCKTKNNNKKITDTSIWLQNLFTKFPQ